MAAVLSGNRNFEGRVHPLTKANYLASPPLVVAYALAGTVDIDLQNDPIGEDQQGNPVFLKDIWFTGEELVEAVKVSANSDYYREVMPMSSRRMNSGMPSALQAKPLRGRRIQPTFASRLSLKDAKSLPVNSAIYRVRPYWATLVIYHYRSYFTCRCDTRGEPNDGIFNRARRRQA